MIFAELGLPAPQLVLGLIQRWCGNPKLLLERVSIRYGHPQQLLYFANCRRALLKKVVQAPQEELVIK
jgi:hypothetical protein